MMRALIPAIALFALFVVPWQVGMFSILVAALFLPPTGLLLGVIADLIYYSPGAAPVPYFTLCGIGCFVLALLVHRFVKTRIME